MCNGNLDEPFKSKFHTEIHVINYTLYSGQDEVIILSRRTKLLRVCNIQCIQVMNIKDITIHRYEDIALSKLLKACQRHSVDNSAD